MTLSRSFVLYVLLEEYAPFSANSGNSFNAKGKLRSTGLEFEIMKRWVVIPLRVDDMPVKDVDLND